MKLLAMSLAWLLVVPCGGGRSGAIQNVRVAGKGAGTAMALASRGSRGLRIGRSVLIVALVAKLSMRSRVEVTPEELFDLLADPDNEVNWNPDVIEVRRIDTGPIGVRSRWEGRYKGMGKMDITIRDYERPLRLAFAVGGSRLHMDFQFALARADSATDLSARADVRPKGAMRLLSPFVGLIMRRTFAKRPAQMAEGVAKRRATRAQPIVEHPTASTANQASQT